jgi:hypothetical protein
MRTFLFVRVSGNNDCIMHFYFYTLITRMEMKEMDSSYLVLILARRFNM